MESALFGLVCLDGHKCAASERLARVAETIGVRGAAIESEGPFAVGVHSRAAGQTASIACCADRSLCVAVTGEIDNQDNLHGGPARNGRFAGKTIAEIVLALFHEHGASFVEHVQGCFNTAIWEARRCRLTLFTDHSGALRPIYYYRGQRLLVFGSTAKTVITHREVPREVDPVALDQVLAFAHPFVPRTLFRGVGVLAGGTFLSYSKGQMEIRPYWQRLPFRDTGEDLHSLGERYYNALWAAVQRILDKRDETGVLLSGGIDSSALVSLLRRAGQDRINTFSIHIGDPANSDRDASHRVAELYRTEHRSLENIGADCLELLPEMLWHYESPCPSLHPTYLISREAGNYCDSVITGHGNDLIWGTMEPRRWTRIWPARATPAVALLAYMRKRRRLSRRAARRLRPAGPATDLGLLAGLARYAVRTGNPLTDSICLEESLLGEQRVLRELGKFILDAHSLGLRMPYADKTVSEVAENVPPDARYGRRDDGRTVLKGFFKDVMNRYRVLPPDIIYRRKTWMHSPTTQWLRGDFGLRIGDVLLDSNARLRGYFDPTVVAELYNEHRAGTRDHGYALAMLTAFETWHRIFIDPPAIRLPDARLSDYRANQPA